MEKKLDDYLEELRAKKKEVEDQDKKEEVDVRFLINKMDIIADTADAIHPSLRDSFCKEHLDPLQNEVDKMYVIRRDNREKYRAEIHKYEKLIEVTEQKIYSLK